MKLAMRLMYCLTNRGLPNSVQGMTRKIGVEILLHGKRGNKSKSMHMLTLPAGALSKGVKLHLQVGLWIYNLALVFFFPWSILCVNFLRETM